MALLVIFQMPRWLVSRRVTRVKASARRNRGRLCCRALHAVRHLIGHCALFLNGRRRRSDVFTDSLDSLLDRCESGSDIT
jgi:hypothetical protein